MNATAPSDEIEAMARAVYAREPFYMPIGQRREGVELARAFEFDDAPAYRQTEAREIAKVALEALRRLSPSPALEDDAANWRALMQAPRIRVYGYAGVYEADASKPRGDEAVHFGADFWSRGPVADDQSGPKVTQRGCDLLKAFVADIRALSQQPESDTP